MKVIPILTTPPGTDPRVTRMVLKTIKTGFPTAEIEVCENDHFEPHYSIIEAELVTHCNYDKPLIFLDGDVIFWSNIEPWIEDWWYQCETDNIAGFYVPYHFNPFSQSLYMARLHTSLLVTRPKEVCRQMESARCGNELTGPYLQSNLIHPHYSYINGSPIYYDTCAELYHNDGGTSFDEKALECYDHVNSASFYQDMLECLPQDQKEAFINLHHTAATQPERLRGLYKKIQKFYDNRRVNIHNLI